MPLGGGSDVSFDSSGIQAAVDFSRNIFEDYALPFTETYRNAGENALSALAFELGVGPRPVYGGTSATAGGPNPAFTEAQSAYDSALSDLRSVAGSLGVSGLSVDRMIKEAGTTYRGNSGGDGDIQIRKIYENQFGPALDRFRSAEAALAGAPQTPVEGTPATPGMVYEGFSGSPGYQFQLEQGQQGVERALNAAGVGRDSGALRKAMAEYSQGVANQNHSNYLAQLAGLAGIGQTGVGQAISSGTNAANSALQGASTIAQGNFAAAAQNAQNQTSAFGDILGLGANALGFGLGGGFSGLFGSSSFAAPTTGLSSFF